MSARGMASGSYYERGEKKIPRRGFSAQTVAPPSFKHVSMPAEKGHRAVRAVGCRGFTELGLSTRRGACKHRLLMSESSITLQVLLYK